MAGQTVEVTFRFSKTGTVGMSEGPPSPSHNTFSACAHASGILHMSCLDSGGSGWSVMGGTVHPNGVFWW